MFDVRSGRCRISRGTRRRAVRELLRELDIVGLANKYAPQIKKRTGKRTGEGVREICGNTYHKRDIDVYKTVSENPQVNTHIFIYVCMWFWRYNRPRFNPRSPRKNRKDWDSSLWGKVAKANITCRPAWHPCDGKPATDRTPKIVPTSMYRCHGRKLQKYIRARFATRTVIERDTIWKKKIKKHPPRNASDRVRKTV